MEGRRPKIPKRNPVVRLKNEQGLGKRFGIIATKKLQIKIQKRFRKLGHGSENENKSSVAFGFKLEEYTFYKTSQTNPIPCINALKGGDVMK
jgi:hypothetical protein